MAAQSAGQRHLALVDHFPPLREPPAAPLSTPPPTAAASLGTAHSEAPGGRPWKAAGAHHGAQEAERAACVKSTSRCA
eukprot:SAG31_NODE_8920_length_1363_cov_1.149525_1_plen_78_part_00